MKENKAPTLAEWRGRVAVQECRYDGTALPDKIDYYPHDGGWSCSDATLEGAEMTQQQIEDYRRHGVEPNLWWLSIRCPKCKYDWSLNKLGVPRS